MATAALASPATATADAPRGEAQPLVPATVPGLPVATGQPQAATAGGALVAPGAPGAPVGAGGNLRLVYDRLVQQPGVRRALPALVAVAALLVLALVYGWMQSSPHRPVLAGLGDAEQQAAYDALRNADFRPRIDTTTGQLTVPADRYHEARIFLAAQGLPKTGAVGLEALKDQSSMTTSQFMEQVRVNAAMEQELARSIMQIGTVQAARVHLATPRQSVFVRERVPPKASVVVTPHPGRAVAASQVQAIVHLVSSSVPYLTPDSVTVVDNLGKLLTESAGELKLGLTAAQTAHKQQLEELYRDRIVQILSPIVGEANVRSQVHLALDFTQVESTTEDYDAGKEGPVPRSETAAEDRTQRKPAEGVPGALSNTVPPPATPASGTQADKGQGDSGPTTTSSSRSTRNYEVDRTVRHVRNAQGAVQRVSVAVLVNERAGVPAPAGAASAPAGAAPAGWSPQEVERMAQLVRGVVGYDDKRGDLVTVVPARFEDAALPPAVPWYLQPEVHQGFKWGLAALMFLAFLLVAVRPVMRALQPAAGVAQDEGPQALADGELSEEDMRMIQIGEGESLEEIKAKLKPKRSSISIDMLDTANTYDDKVALIRMLVAEDSGRVANVLKGMIRAS